MKKNYQAELDKILDTIQSSAKRPSLLLHACCAPCSSYVLEYLSEYFLITVYFYNPNIHPQEEYERRFFELKKFLSSFPSAVKNGVRFIHADYVLKEFENAVRVSDEPSLAFEKERGTRCERCYTFRMKKAYEYACQNGYEWFTTTLSISPFKDADRINEIGKRLEESSTEGVKFLTSDFKKRNGFKRSLELSAEFELYRQKYCGCKYSLAACYREVQE